MQPTLSLCMIVKNEAAHLPRCLASVRGLVDETIIVDTGSTDETVAIARAAGATVIPFVWRDDFSAARNVSLEHATMDWILVLDADEALAPSDHAAIRACLAAPDVTQYTLIQTTYVNNSAVIGWLPNGLAMPEAQGFEGYCESPLVRLFRRRPEIRFTGIIHEHVAQAQSATRIVATPIRIHHYGGYTDRSVSDRKGELYLRLTEAKCRQHPERAHVWCELGSQYMMLDRIDEAREALQRAAALDPTSARPHIALGCIAHNRDEWDQALVHFAEALRLEPTNLCAYYYLPVILLASGRVALAETIAAQLEPYLPAVPVFRVNCAVLQMQVGNFRKAIRLLHAVDAAGDPLVWLNLGLCYASLSDAPQARHWLTQAAAHAHTAQLASSALAEIARHVR